MMVSRTGNVFDKTGEMVDENTKAQLRQFL
jgi:hypothetical protein